MSTRTTQRKQWHSADTYGSHALGNKALSVTSNLRDWYNGLPDIWHTNRYAPEPNQYAGNGKHYKKGK